MKTAVDFLLGGLKVLVLFVSNRVDYYHMPNSVVTNPEIGTCRVNLATPNKKHIKALQRQLDLHLKMNHNFLSVNGI